MKAQVKVSPVVIIEIEAVKQKDLFKAIASAHEVFGEKKCGLCGCTDILPVWRTVTQIVGKKSDTFEFPEYHCQGYDKTANKRCGARLALGTMNDDSGTIYPNRKLVNGERLPNKDERKKGLGTYGPHRGWHRFVGKPEDEQEGGDAK